MAMVPVVLIVGFGGTGALVALSAADRTAHAYGRYLEGADVGDLLINLSLNSTDMDAAIRALPGVRSVTSDALFVTSLDEGAPRALGDVGDAEIVQVRGSVDGRYSAMDRPALVEGRHPTGDREALASVEMAEAKGIDVGDVLAVSFWTAAGEGEVVDPGTVVPPIGVEHLRVVGIATLADEVLPDRLYHRERLIVSPDVAARYDCLPRVPARDASLEEAVAALLPSDCATSYRYYSLDLAGGEAGVAVAQEAAHRQADELTADLPRVAVDDGAAYIAIATTTAQERQRVERSVQPTVAALAALGLAAGAVAVVVAGLAVARELRRSEVERSQWWQLGMSTIDRTSAVVAPLLTAAAIGLVAAVALAWWLSPIGPVGNVRSVAPSPGRELSGWAGLGALGLTVMLGGGILGLAFVSARRVGRARGPRRDSSAWWVVATGWARPELTEGLRAAYGGRGSGLVVGGGGAAAAVFLTAVVFGTSLSALISSPASYGWTWDLAVMGNVGYGPLDLEAVGHTLDANDDVSGWTALSFTSAVSLDGEPLLSMVRHDHTETADLAVVEGELPNGDDQVALGTRTAIERGIAVGDRVEVAASGLEPWAATVSGLVVFPAVGPFLADRATPGSGMLLPSAMVPEGVPVEFGFVGIDVVGDASPRIVQADLRDDVLAWDTAGEGVIEYAAPIRPPEIDDARSIRTLPSTVGGLLVFAAVVGLAFAVVMSVRARRRELAILRALGFTGRQIRASVRVQTVATAIVALVIGVPSGIVMGRVGWRAFASQLGVVPDPSTPGLWILVTVAGGLAVAGVAATIPARVAGRAGPAAALRSE